MTVADIVRNAARTGFTTLTHHPDHGELSLELDWRCLARDSMSAQGASQIEPCRGELQDG